MSERVRRRPSRLQSGPAPAPLGGVRVQAPARLPRCLVPKGAADRRPGGAGSIAAPGRAGPLRLARRLARWRAAIEISCKPRGWASSGQKVGPRARERRRSNVALPLVKSLRRAAHPVAVAARGAAGRARDCPWRAQGSAGCRQSMGGGLRHALMAVAAILSVKGSGVCRAAQHRTGVRASCAAPRRGRDHPGTMGRPRGGAAPRVALEGALVFRAWGLDGSGY